MLTMNTLNDRDYLDDVTAMSAYRVAELAGCAIPDHRESPGAVILADLRDALVEAWREGRYEWDRDRNDNDTTFEIAGEHVPDHYNDMWAVFVDLGVWGESNEHTGDGTWSGTWTDMCMEATRQVLDRAALAIVREIRGCQQDKWECALCGDSGAPLICSPDECNGSDSDRMLWQALTEPGAEAVMTGPVELPVTVSDPILDLLRDAEAAQVRPAMPGEDTGRFLSRMAQVNEEEFAARRKYRRGWLITAGVVVVYVLAAVAFALWT